MTLWVLDSFPLGLNTIFLKATNTTYNAIRVGFFKCNLSQGKFRLSAPPWERQCLAQVLHHSTESPDLVVRTASQAPGQWEDRSGKKALLEGGIWDSWLKHKNEIKKQEGKGIRTSLKPKHNSDFLMNHHTAESRQADLCLTLCNTLTQPFSSPIRKHQQLSQLGLGELSSSQLPANPPSAQDVPASKAGGAL